MKTRLFLFVLLMCVGSLHIIAQDSRKVVENGIAQVERLIEAHKWHEAFEQLRAVEASATGNPVNMYLATKQRYRMYYRINKHHEAADCMQRMESLAMGSNNTQIIEDMLHVKAGYYAAKGDTKVSRECYRQMLNRRAAGKDDAGIEACFKQMIDEASKTSNHTMKSVVSALYTSWQDSIAAVRADAELKTLKENYQAAQEDIESKDTKIGVQWGTIIVLGLLLVGVTVAALFLLLIMTRNARTIRNLRHSLEMSNQNSAQKSTFMRNIGSQISPSLAQIAKGNSKEHIAALEKMLADVETFIALDDSKEEKYEADNANVAEICEQSVGMCADCAVPVTTEASKMSFPVAKEEVKQVISSIVHEMTVAKDVERVAIDFKKRNPHTGQFIVTIVGKKLSEEDKQTLFTAFAKVYDLTQTSGLILPICSLMAHKMGGSLSLDEQFAKGTRFVLEVHC